LEPIMPIAVFSGWASSNTMRAQPFAAELEQQPLHGAATDLADAHAPHRSNR